MPTRCRWPESLIHDGAVLGAIAIGRISEREPAFSALECEALTLLAAQAALSLANSHLLEEVSELAIRDALTGLYNRRHFDATVDHILRRRARHRGARPPLAAVMFDLDHFGRFNRDHGHQAGDAVLRSFAGILLERFRSSDLVARYGGEEFVAILESATVENARQVAEEVRVAGRSLDHRARGHEAPGDRVGRMCRARRSGADPRGAAPGGRCRAVHGQASGSQQGRRSLPPSADPVAIARASKPYYRRVSTSFRG